MGKWIQETHAFALRMLMNIHDLHKETYMTHRYMLAQIKIHDSHRMEKEKDNTDSKWLKEIQIGRAHV